MEIKQRQKRQIAFFKENGVKDVCLKNGRVRVNDNVYCFSDFEGIPTWLFQNVDVCGDIHLGGLTKISKGTFNGLVAHNLRLDGVKVIEPFAFVGTWLSKLSLSGLTEINSIGVFDGAFVSKLTIGGIKIIQENVLSGLTACRLALPRVKAIENLSIKGLTANEIFFSKNWEDFFLKTCGEKKIPNGYDSDKKILLVKNKAHKATYVDNLDGYEIYECYFGGYYALYNNYFEHARIIEHAIDKIKCEIRRDKFEKEKLSKIKKIKQDGITLDTVVTEKMYHLILDEHAMYPFVEIFIIDNYNEADEEEYIKELVYVIEHSGLEWGVMTVRELLSFLEHKDTVERYYYTCAMSEKIRKYIKD